MRDLFITDNIEEILAGRGNRMVAAIIDYMLFWLPAYFVLLFIKADMRNPAYLTFGIYFLVLTFIQIVYLSDDGQTIGKKLTKIKIVRVKDNTTGGFITNCILRSLLSVILSIIPVYLIFDILFILRKDRRCLHDMIVGTRVIEVYSKEIYRSPRGIRVGQNMK